MRLLLFIALFFIATPARAQDGNVLTIGLAENRVGITTGFDGANLVLFGMKKEPGELAVLIRGPEKEMVVRHKSRVLGIWMNRAAIRFRSVPAYYDFAVGSNESALGSVDVRARHGIGLDSLDFEYTGREDDLTVQRFREALIRNKQSQGHFPLSPEDIVFLNGDFFKVNFYLPSDVPSGDYRVQAFLFQDGIVRAIRETTIRVGQEGTSARIFLFAHRQSFIYGLLTVMLAVFSGWTAWAFLRRE